MTLINPGVFVDWASLYERHETKAGRLIRTAAQLSQVDLPVDKVDLQSNQLTAKWCRCQVIIHRTPQTNGVKVGTIVTLNLRFVGEYDKNRLPIFEGALLTIPANKYLDLVTMIRPDKYLDGVMVGYAKATNILISPGDLPQSVAKCLIFKDQLPLPVASSLANYQTWLVRVVELRGYLKQDGLPVYAVRPITCIKSKKTPKR